MHMCPDIVNNSLISRPKCSEANYVTILTPTEVLIFDDDELKITVNKEAIIRWWKEQKPDGLWRIPLSADVPKHKAKYMVLPKKAQEAINNVYDLPLTKQTIRYLDACAGYPTKKRG